MSATTENKDQLPKTDQATSKKVDKGEPFDELVEDLTIADSNETSQASELANQDNIVEQHRAAQAHLDKECSENCGLATPGSETLKTTTTALLLGLPTEIHCQVIEELSMLERLALKFSCSYFNRFIASARVSSSRDNKHRFMNMHVRKMETWTIFAFRDLYGCTCCARLRPTQHFSKQELARAHKWRKRRMCYSCKTHCKAYDQRYRLSKAHLCMVCESYAPDEDIDVGGLCTLCEDELFDGLE